MTWISGGPRPVDVELDYSHNGQHDKDRQNSNLRRIDARSVVVSQAGPHLGHASA
jgi:hypothetical protein